MSRCNRCILDLSRETEHPRAYEVAGQLIKTVEIQRETFRYTKENKRIRKRRRTKDYTQHNHLYVGSTSDLQKFLKKNGKAEK